jgi:hypothetical protein
MKCRLTILIGRIKIGKEALGLGRIASENTVQIFYIYS